MNTDAFSFFRDGRNYSGNFVIDEQILKEEGMTDFSQYACVEGQTEFMPDFFLDDFDEYVKGHKEIMSKASQPAMKSLGSESGGGVVQPVFDKIGTVINEDIVKKIGAVYAFEIKGDPSQCGNLKNLLSLRFYVKSILENLQVQNLPFLQF